MTKQEQKVIIYALAHQNKAFRKLSKEHKISKKELEILLICCHICEVNDYYFERLDIAKQSEFHVNNIYIAVENLRQKGLVEQLTNTRQWFTSHRFTVTGLGLRVVRQYLREVDGCT